MEIILTFKSADIMVPVEMTGVIPEKLKDMSEEDIKNITLLQGKSEVKLGELFDVEINESDDLKLIIKNSSDRLKRVGEKMKEGEIIVEGDVGMYVGVEMKGGKITVNGNADSWAGMNLKGGELIIKGDAKDYVGSAYRGDWRGMSGGKIVVEGNAGNEIGEYLKKGIIHIKGNVKSLAGIRQHGGIIIIDGNPEDRFGGQMVKGAIVINGKVNEVLPSFKYEGIVEDPVIKLSKKDEGTPIKGKYYKFTGDYAVSNPKGQLYISVDANPDLR